MELTQEELVALVGDVHRADSMLISDWPQEMVDAVFFHARSHGDYEQLFGLVANFYHDVRGLC